jgi:prepilin-type N-terminal cleavage/methylation domain-containing protein
MHKQKDKKGFTLLEILLVIGIIATLAVIIMVALDPAKRFEDARNSRRLSDIQSVLSAVQQYIVDNEGAVPSGVNDSEMQIGSATDGCDISNTVCSVGAISCLDLSSPLARYLKEIPHDPQQDSSQRTHYSIQMDSNNIITIRACDSTDSKISAVSR